MKSLLFGWLARRFARQGAAAIREKRKSLPKRSSRTKLAVVVGHNAKAKGAKSPWLPAEYDFHVEQASRIKSASIGTDVEVRTFFRKPGGGYKAEIERVYDEVDEWGADYSVELHYNAATPLAEGTETLRSATKGSRLLAEAVHPVVLKTFKRRNRGIKMLRHGARGYEAIIAGRAPAIIIEPAFGSSKAGASSMQENWPVFAPRLIAAIAKLGRA